MNSNQSICRICCSDDGLLLNIFGSDIQKVTYVVDIDTCLALKVAQDDGFPQVICVKCAGKLSECASYVKTVHRQKKRKRSSLPCGKCYHCGEKGNYLFPIPPDSSLKFETCFNLKVPDSVEICHRCQFHLEVLYELRVKSRNAQQNFVKEKLPRHEADNPKEETVGSMVKSLSKKFAPKMKKSKVSAQSSDNSPVKSANDGSCSEVSSTVLDETESSSDEDVPLSSFMRPSHATAFEDKESGSSGKEKDNSNDSVSKIKKRRSDSQNANDDIDLKISTKKPKRSSLQKRRLSEDNFDTLLGKPHVESGKNDFQDIMDASEDDTHPSVQKKPRRDSLGKRNQSYNSDSWDTSLPPLSEEADTELGVSSVETSSKISEDKNVSIALLDVRKFLGVDYFSKGPVSVKQFSKLMPSGKHVHWAKDVEDNGVTVKGKRGRQIDLKKTNVDEETEAKPVHAPESQSKIKGKRPFKSKKGLKKLPRHREAEEKSDVTAVEVAVADSIDEGTTSTHSEASNDNLQGSDANKNVSPSRLNSRRSAAPKVTLNEQLEDDLLTDEKDVRQKQAKTLGARSKTQSLKASADTSNDDQQASEGDKNINHSRSKSRRSATFKVSFNEQLEDDLLTDKKDIKQKQAKTLGTQNKAQSLNTQAETSNDDQQASEEDENINHSRSKSRRSAALKVTYNEQLEDDLLSDGKDTKQKQVKTPDAQSKAQFVNPPYLKNFDMGDTPKKMYRPFICPVCHAGYISTVKGLLHKLMEHDPRSNFTVKITRCDSDKVNSAEASAVIDITPHENGVMDDEQLVEDLVTSPKIRKAGPKSKTSYLHKKSSRKLEKKSPESCAKEVSNEVEKENPSETVAVANSDADDSHRRMSVEVDAEGVKESHQFEKIIATSEASKSKENLSINYGNSENDSARVEQVSAGGSHNGDPGLEDNSLEASVDEIRNVSAISSGNVKDPADTVKQQEGGSLIATDAEVSDSAESATAPANKSKSKSDDDSLDQQDVSEDLMKDVAAPLMEKRNEEKSPLEKASVEDSESTQGDNTTEAADESSEESEECVAKPDNEGTSETADESPKGDSTENETNCKASKDDAERASEESRDKDSEVGADKGSEDNSGKDSDEDVDETPGADEASVESPGKGSTEDGDGASVEGGDGASVEGGDVASVDGTDEVSKEDHNESSAGGEETVDEEINKTSKVEDSEPADSGVDKASENGAKNSSERIVDEDLEVPKEVPERIFEEDSEAVHEATDDVSSS